MVRCKRVGMFDNENGDESEEVEQVVEEDENEDDYFGLYGFKVKKIRSGNAKSCEKTSLCGKSSRVNNVNCSGVTGSLPMVLTDPELLDCDICFEPLRNNIYQCENGHIACHSCRMKMEDKCPSCKMQISSNRCRAMEKLMESVIVECQNRKFGCRETFVYYKKHDHEQECPNMGCFCPYPKCTFADSYKNLYVHFTSEHKSAATSFSYNTIFSVSVEKNQKYVILQERNEGFLFVLKHHVRRYGRLVSVVCIGSSLLDNQFVYRLTAKCVDTSFSLESVPEVHTMFDHQIQSKNSLTIPLSSLDKIGRVSVCLSIKKAPKV